MPRRKPSDMKKMSIEQQQEVQQRIATRRDVRDANERLIALVITWLTGGDIPIKIFYKRFHASGHEGEYQETPSETLRKRLALSQVKTRLKETALDWMGAIELSYVYERIQMMIEALASQLRGTMDDALALYEEVGEAIRSKVYAEMGYWPEEFPVPSDRITGEESDELFKPTNHQPTLF